MQRAATCRGRRGRASARPPTRCPRARLWMPRPSGFPFIPFAGMQRQQRCQHELPAACKFVGHGQVNGRTPVQGSHQTHSALRGPPSNLSSLILHLPLQHTPSWQAAFPAGARCSRRGARQHGQQEPLGAGPAGARHQHEGLMQMVAGFSIAGVLVVDRCSNQRPKQSATST